MEIQKNKLQVGEILATCWGYEQTNWDFYQIVKVSEKSIWIREIDIESTPCGYETYETKPIKDKFRKNSKVIRKVIQKYMKLNDFQYLQHHNSEKTVIETKYY